MDGSLSIAAHHQGGQYTPDHHLRRGHRTAYGSATIIVTSATASYTRWLAHLHRNLKFFGRGDQLTVCAEDEPTADFARSRGLRVLQQSASSNALDGRRSVGETYMTQAWYRLVHGKQFCVWGLLARSADGATILLLDGDITLFRDPLPVLPPVNLAFMDDRWRRTTDFYNSGFFMVRASAATRAFGKLYVDALRANSSKSRNDQSVLNELIGRGRATLPIIPSYLDGEAFQNGARFYVDRDR